jgi:hypothetical protein
MQSLERVQNVRIGSNIPRTNVDILGRSKPLHQRPVVNYSQVEASVDFIKSNISPETMLGFVNSSTIVSGLTDARALGNSYAVRNMQVYFAPTNSSNYNGLIDLKSGVLTSYSIQGSVNEPVRASLGFQFLDMSGSVNTSARDTLNYDAALVKPENSFLTGIGFTGYGVTGLTIQSFSVNLGFSRTQVLQLGNSPFPADRPLTDVSATVQVQGFFEGINNSLTGLCQFSCGNPTEGLFALSLYPSCSTASPTTYTFKNAYVDSVGIEGSVGSFSTVSFSFSLPLGVNPNETTDGSVMIVS